VPIIPPDVVAAETLPRWLYQLAERYGDAEALVEPAGEARTFGELGRRVTALSQTLAEAGVRRGGRVAYLLPNSAFIIEQFLAATRLGAVSLGINTRSRLHDLRTVPGPAGRMLTVVRGHVMVRGLVACPPGSPASMR